jgi:hypothetical protein
LDLLDHVQEVPAVPVCHRDQRLPGVGVERQRCSEQVLGSADQRVEGGVVETFQDEHLAAGEQRTVELEAGVLGRRADEDDRAVLDVGQERILLRPVEAVDLIDEEQRALPHLAAPLCGLEHLSQVCDTGKRRRQGLEGEVGLLGEAPGDRGLPAARRPPQDHRHQPLRSHHPPDRGVVCEQVVLPDHISQCAGPQPVCQGPGRVIHLEQGRRLVHESSSVWCPTARS